ncbi:MAG: hypothetical protein AAFX76_11165 [Planctomycetota bacterium]
MASAFPATIPVRLDAEGRIDNDVHCPACDYNLRMQRVEGACPECGAAVDVVDRDDFDMLDRADPGWRRRVGRGAKLLHWGAIAAMPLVLPGLLLATAGLWLMTGREPGKDEGWKARGTRLSARWASVLAAGAGIWLLVLFLGREGNTRHSLRAFWGHDWKLFDILFCTVGAAFAVAMLEAWRHLFKLAARADGPRIAQRCRAAWKAYLWGVGVVVAIAAAVNLGERTGIKLPVEVWSVFAAATAGAVVAVCGVLWWVTVRLAGEFRALLAEAGSGSGDDG